MLKWLGLRPTSRAVRADQLTEEELQRADQPSLFLLAKHHHMAGLADWPACLGVATYNSLLKAGFADGWTLPLHGGPRRHPLLDSGTTSEFVTLCLDVGVSHLAQLTVKEAYAWDLHYRSDIYATGFSFNLSLPEKAMEMLIEKIRVGQYDWMGDSSLYFLALRIPVRQEFSFPEPRATDQPYSEGPFPRPLRQAARFGVDWIEVAALDAMRMQHEHVKELPLCELFVDAGPVRLSLDRA